MQVVVRDNNVDQALRALKKKMQREGIFREMKLRNYYEKPSEKRAREKAEAIRRARKLARKKAQREGGGGSRPRAASRAVRAANHSIRVSSYRRKPVSRRISPCLRLWIAAYAGMTEWSLAHPPDNRGCYRASPLAAAAISILRPALALTLTGTAQA